MVVRASSLWMRRRDLVESRRDLIESRRDLIESRRDLIESRRDLVESRREQTHFLHRRERNFCIIFDHPLSALSTRVDVWLLGGRKIKSELNGCGRLPTCSLLLEGAAPQLMKKALNSIRHNLSLHSRFVRVQNEGTGKSSWWTLNPDSKAGATKTHRRRANTVESQKCGDKKRKGRSKKTSAELSPVMGSSVGLTTGSMNMLNLEGGSSGGPSLSPTSSSVSESLDFTSTVTLSGDQLETFGASSSISDSLDPYSSQPGTPLRHNNSYCLAGDLPQLSSSGRDDIRQILSSTSSSSSAWTGFPSYTQSSMEFATNGDHGMLDTLKLAQKLSVKSNGSSVGSPGGSGFHSPNVSSSSSPSSTVTSRIPQPPTSGPPQITPLRIGSNGYVPGSAYGSFGGASSSHLPPQSQSTQEFSPTPPVTTQSSTLGYTALVSRYGGYVN
ncbi:unnamed protein product [Cyprideis torosa]|uniref:Uncharacterized protein n=1 Tax=Cyprideis torosa TaxID=163714 RepID=A0A7R8WFM0_9CRUS|nr:unnamed protein product [Cyprideis torosa]CAG0897174.1 unnamed protein product [Cyprideis torosa]